MFEQSWNLSNAPYRYRHRDVEPVSELRTVPGNTRVKFEVRSFNRFGAISIQPQKFRGHVSLAMPPFRKFCKGSYPDCRWKHARQN